MFLFYCCKFHPVDTEFIDDHLQMSSYVKFLVIFLLLFLCIYWLSKYFFHAINFGHIPFPSPSLSKLPLPFSLSKFILLPTTKCEQKSKPTKRTQNNQPKSTQIVGSPFSLSLTILKAFNQSFILKINSWLVCPKFHVYNQLL